MQGKAMKIGRNPKFLHCCFLHTLCSSRPFEHKRINRAAGLALPAPPANILLQSHPFRYPGIICARPSEIHAE